MTVRASVHTPDLPHIRKEKYLKFSETFAKGNILFLTQYMPDMKIRTWCLETIPIRTYSTSSHSNLVNRTYCPKPFEATDLNGSLDRQCALCSRYCEGDMFERKVISVVSSYFLNLYRLFFLFPPHFLKKNST